MSEVKTKLVRNSGSAITVEYGGQHYTFPAGRVIEVPEDLADVAQFRHGNVGLLIVHEEAEAEEEQKAEVAAALAAAEAEGLPPVPADETFKCVCEASFATADEFIEHQAKAHPPAPVPATEPAAIEVPAAPVSESPSPAATPAPESPSSEPTKES